MKTCTKCLEEKPPDAFSRRTISHDGLQQHCKSCKLTYQKANPNRNTVSKRYRDANKEECNARTRLAQSKKRGYYTQQTLDWQAANRDRYLSTRRDYYVKNSAAEIARVRRRAGKIRHGYELMAHAEKAEVQAMYDFCRIFPIFEVDHIAPLNGKNVSGLHVLANLQVLEKSINRSKGNKFMPETAA